MSSEETRDTQDTNVTWRPCQDPHHEKTCRVYKRGNHYVPKARMPGRPRAPARKELRKKIGNVSEEQARRLLEILDGEVKEKQMSDTEGLDDVISGLGV